MRKSLLSLDILQLLTVCVNRYTLNLMPKLVRSSELVVRRKKSNYHLLPTTHFKVKRGFTLIELLIVITIIGILASLTLASYGNAQSKGRDGVRKSDLAQMKRALELAKSDCSGSAWYPYFTDYTSLATYLADPDLKYLSSVIEDPQNSDPQVYKYVTSAISTNLVCPNDAGLLNPPTEGINGATDYSLWVKLERPQDAQSLDSRKKCKNKPGRDGPTTDWELAVHAGYFVICNN